MSPSFAVYLRDALIEATKVYTGEHETAPEASADDGPGRPA